MSEGHRFLSDEQLDRMHCGAAHAPGYPKIPNQPHERQEIDAEALQDFMPVDTKPISAEMTSRALFCEVKAQPNTDIAWTVAFTVPALFARVKNLEAQVLSGWSMIEDRQREIAALVSQRNATFQSDRRSQGPYRLQIREAGTTEDRNCFGLPTVLHVQSYVPRTMASWHENDDAVYEGKYVLLQNHRGDRAMTSAAVAERAVEGLTQFLPGPFTEREDPDFVVQQAIDALKNRKLLLQERAETEAALRKLEVLIAGAQKALMAAQNGKAPKTNMQVAMANINTLLDRLIELRGEDPDTHDEPAIEEL